MCLGSFFLESYGTKWVNRPTDRLNAKWKAIMRSKIQSSACARAILSPRARFPLTQWNCARSFVGLFRFFCCFSSFFEFWMAFWDFVKNGRIRIPNLWASPRSRAQTHRRRQCVHARTMIDPNPIDHEYARRTHCPEKMLSALSGENCSMLLSYSSFVFGHRDHQRI